MENSFGNFLRQKRQEKSLTQKELAKRLFVSESAVSKWEKDVAHPDITLLPRLAEILDVTEHELITASVDNQAREERRQAKRWRALSFSWNLFFYIAYAAALIPCFICNLAIDRTLSWFWIVAASLLLGFTFTNLPGLIKRHKLVFVPLSQYFALVVLLGVCCLYTKGSWFWIPSLSVLFGLLCVFVPIYIAKYGIFSKIRKYNDFVSVAVDFAMLQILLLVIQAYTAASGYVGGWYLKIAFPITLAVYLALNVLLCVRFLKVNTYIKTGVVLTLANAFLYLPPAFIRVSDPLLQREINDANIFKANLLSWQVGVTLEQNIHLIVCLTALTVAVAFLVIGFILRRERKEKGSNSPL